MIEMKDLRYLSELYVSVCSIAPWNEYWECDWAEERLTWIFDQRSEQREKPLRGKPPLRLLSKKAPYHNAFPRDCHLNLVQMLECPVCACRRRGVVAPFYGGVISDSQGFLGYLATINGEIIGAILGNFVPFKGIRGFKILEFYVDSKYQKQGIGSKLLHKLEYELKTNGYNFITLLTAKNSEAESFYLRKEYQINDKLELLDKKF